VNPNVRRDLITGGALVVAGVGLLAFAWFGPDEGFRAPRWIVGLIALACLLAGAIPLRDGLRGERIVGTSPVAALATAGMLAVLAIVALWVMVAVGPEGAAMTFDIPVAVSEDAHRDVVAFLFYAVLGVVALSCVAGAAGALFTLHLGHTAKVTAIASVAALVVWIGLEWHARASQPMAPVLHLSFDKGFPAEGYLARPHGNEVVARPGRVGSGLFIGGDEDWLEVQAPQGFDTRQGMTLAFWMRREAWVNPYVKGAATQTVATVQLERLWRGKPEAQQVTFSFTANTARPQARVGEVRLVPSRAISIAPQRWTHVAVVYDRFLFDRMRLYVDGRRVARAAPWAAAPGFADIRSVRIGTWFERNGAYRGMVDEVKVYARALTDAEIEAEAAAGS
jgi:hypothetical protein